MQHLLLINIKQLCGVETGESRKSRIAGADMKNLPSIDNAWLYIEHGRIHSFGSMEQEHFIQCNDIIDCKNQNIILPAWVDSHTHLVFAGSREGEFRDRINGLSYEEIAKRGGGILNSAAKLNAASEDELYHAACERLHRVMAQGTGAIEIKSGYGLSVEGELKMLKVIRRLKESVPIPVKASFLAAHAYPADYKQNHDGYLNLIINEMLPQIADEGLADYIDAFCEEGFFSVDETSRILEAGAKYGLKPKIHANQLHYSGGVQVGVKYNAVSVDHLECVGDAEIEALKAAIPCLPCCRVLPSS